jgi:hypothetical protein
MLYRAFIGSLFIYIIIIININIFVIIITIIIIFIDLYESVNVCMPTVYSLLGINVRFISESIKQQTA